MQHTENMISNQTNMQGVPLLPPPSHSRGVYKKLQMQVHNNDLTAFVVRVKDQGE